ncbi:MAG: hypothetical protein R3E94_08345 [Burkholderiaceae bacterium]
MNRPRTLGAADRIRASLAEVESLRSDAGGRDLQDGVLAVKHLQAVRFKATYTDYLTDPRYAPAVRFFLEELYGAHDFSRRDAQFHRIAGALERLFPAAVGDLAVDLARMHALTERLDHALSAHWCALPSTLDNATRYVKAWRMTGDPDARSRQLEVVLHMGRELQQLTRNRSLRMALRMMRRPAAAAGLSDLQHFLERGFDAFAGMPDINGFLATISSRESDWMRRLFDEEERTAIRELAGCTV